MEKFGKPFTDVMQFTRTDRKTNEADLAEVDRVSNLYARQPRRTHCKLCDSPLPGWTDFLKHRIPYVSCRTCTHLNGMYEDTEEFCNAVYVDGGESYAAKFLAESRAGFAERVVRIYKPKAEFLKDALEADGVEIPTVSVLDVGAGLGHFIAAARAQGIRCAGLEASPAQAKAACALLEDPHAVARVDITDTARAIETTESEVVSLIGVLEHLRNPREVLSALKENRRIKYLYASVPLFSPAVYVEASFPDVAPRHLSGGHTHLFTRGSIVWMHKHYGFRCASSWWFGLDVADMFRSIALQLPSDKVREEWTDMIRPALDGMQLALDQQRLSSEVHLLYALR